MGRILTGLLVAASLVTPTASAAASSGAAPSSAAPAPRAAVAPRPIAPHVRAVWLPDVNWSSQHRVTTYAGRHEMRTLLHDIAAAPRFPRGAFACPMDDGTAVRLTFVRIDDVRSAHVSLSGCPVVSGLSRSPKVLTHRIARDLMTFAPRRWLPRLHRF